MRGPIEKNPQYIEVLALAEQVPSNILIKTILELWQIPNPYERLINLKSALKQYLEENNGT